MRIALLCLLPSGLEAYCCWWPETADRCDACASQAESSNYCAGGKSQCEDSCGAVWCGDDDDDDDGGDGDDDDDGASPAPTATPAPVDASTWYEGT